MGTLAHRLRSRPFTSGRSAPSQRRGPPCCSAVVEMDVQQFTWTGSDEFMHLQDRVDAPPLPLPSITAARRVVLVRHGESTWNAEGRIQGSSNWATLTRKGVAQAETTRNMLKDDTFGALYVSPLARARETAEVIMDGQGVRLEPKVLPALREVDLYSFQGLLKAEGKERFGQQFKEWQARPNGFSIDGHAPVRELWHRASMAWEDILQAPHAEPSTSGASDTDGSSGGGRSSSSGAKPRGPALSGSALAAMAAVERGDDANEGGAASGSGRSNTVLVVAHNAVNQALIGTALGLPPVYFRRLLQSNAATSVLDFTPSAQPDQPPKVTLDRLNQSPGTPFRADARVPGGRIVMLRHSATAGSAAGVLLGKLDEPLSSLGVVQASKVSEFLMDMQVSLVMSSPARRCLETARLLADMQRSRGGTPLLALGGLSGAPGPRMLTLQELGPLDVGSWQGQPARLLRGTGSLPPDAECLDAFWQRTRAAWDAAVAAASEGGGRDVVIVAHAAVVAAMVGHCLGLGEEALAMFRFDTGGVTLVDLTQREGQEGGVLRCSNFTAHLGRWSVPITNDQDDTVCGIDGCF